ncbi:MAG: hypothetical protein JWM57_2796 [Phycisphaerales bacterium]|nr:hypothetical protein [Phycisphaerales bacterium]
MRLNPVNRRLALVVASAAVANSLLAIPALAASDSWSTAPTDSNWSNGVNWVTGTPPGDTTSTTNTDTATFGQSSILSVIVDANRNLQNITLTGPTSASVYAYTISGGPLLLTSGGLLIATSASSTGASTISAPIVLEGDNGTYTFQSDIPGSSRLLTISGAVSGVSTAGNTTTLTLTGANGAINNVSGTVSDGVAGGKVAVVKSGNGQWSFATAQSYTGGTTISGGTLRTNSSGNTNGLFGTGAITLQTGGFLRLGSTTATTVNSAVVVGTGGGGVSYRGSGTFSPTSLTGTGTLTLTTEQVTNTITPTTFAGFGGTINVTNTAAVPTAGTIIRLATAFDNTSFANATLNLNANTSLNRQAGTNQPNNAANTATIGGLSGTGGFFGGSGAGSGNFVYNIGNNNLPTSYSGVIGNGGSITTIGKVGNATLTLAGANSYTGGTTITAGTLNINGINALGGANYGLFVTNPALRFSGGTLQYATTLTSSSDISTNPGTAAAAVVTFTSTAVIDTNGNDVTYANAVGNAGAGGLTKSGTGSLTLNGANNYTGTTTVTAGTLKVATAAQAPVLTAAGGADIQGGVLQLTYSGSSPVAQVKTILNNEYATNGGNFTTGQIRSTTAAANRTIGYGDNGTDTVTLLLTLPGDANLNGTVDFNDFLVLQNNFNAPGTRFDQGNFNYDGVTDFNDFLVLQNNFGQSVTGEPVAFTKQQVDAITAFASANAVPEPTTLTVLGLGGMLLGRRRRRA